jgi:hypothetical protein
MTGWQEQALGAAEKRRVVDHDPGEFGEGDGEQREVDPADGEAETEIADDASHEHREQDRRHHPEHRRDPELAEKIGRCVGADADEERVADGEEPGETQHQVPGLADEGEIEHERAHRDHVGARPQRPGNQEHEEGSEQAVTGDG